MRRWIRFTQPAVRPVLSCVPLWSGPIPQPRPEPTGPPSPSPDRRIPVKTIPVAPRTPAEAGPVRYLVNRHPAPFTRPDPARQAGNHRRSPLGLRPARHAGHRRGQRWWLAD